MITMAAIRLCVGQGGPGWQEGVWDQKHVQRVYKGITGE